MFVIDHRGPHSGFELSRYVNVIRTALPADRSADVQFFVGNEADYEAGRPGTTGDREHDAIARDAFARARPAFGEPHAAFLLRPFNQDGWAPEAGRPAGALVRILRAPEPDRFPTSEVAPDVDGLHAAFVPPLTLGLLALLALLGAGWVARLGPGATAEGWALAPVVGAAAVVLFGVAFDAVGLRLGSWGGAAVLAALAASAFAWRGSRGRPPA